ncbi:MAG: hypothetical protein EBU88_15395 [Acidobacteria bacterium]|nr:hypothetical protein [Acidobacteriota bacterium]
MLKAIGLFLLGIVAIVIFFKLLTVLFAIFGLVWWLFKVALQVAIVVAVGYFVWSFLQKKRIVS